MSRKIRKPGGMRIIVVVGRGTDAQESAPMRLGSNELIRYITQLEEAGTHYKTRKAPAVNGHLEHRR